MLLFLSISLSFSIQSCILVQNTKNNWRKLFGQHGRNSILLQMCQYYAPRPIPLLFGSWIWIIEEIRTVDGKQGTNCTATSVNALSSLHLN